MSKDKQIKSELPYQRNNRWRGLITQIAKGDKDSLGRFYDETNRLLYSLAYKILQDSDDAEEVMLDVFKYIWTSAAVYDPEKGNPSTWIVMLIRSRAIDRLRRRKIFTELPETYQEESSFTELDPEYTVLDFERRRIVLDALSELTPKQRRVVELSYYSQFNQTEIADILDIPIGSVKSTLRLAKDKLRKVLVLLNEDT